MAKLCNNLIAGVAAVAVSEAFRIAEGFGVDAKVLTDVIAKSSGNTWVMEPMHPVPGLVGKAPSSRDYAPGFMTDLMAKDLGLAVNAARELRVPVVVAPAAQQALRLASSHGYGRKDFTSIYLFLKPQATKRLFDILPTAAPARSLRRRANSQGGPPCLYVMLSTLSESGRKVLRERPGWIRKVNADVERMGARVVAQYAVLGPYDFVTVIEAPDNPTISRISVELGARGSVSPG